MNLDKIQLRKNPLARELFSDIAREAANSLLDNENLNKSTQIRKFYDELIMWRDKVYRAEDKEEAYRNVEPFIQMLQAKVAYAKSRKYVDQKFVDLLTHIVDQINSVESLNNAKLFFEAVLGFRKSFEKK